MFVNLSEDEWDDVITGQLPVDVLCQ